MEGVIDAAMRRLLTGIGGYTRCVTEFIRVTNVLLPEKVFFRLCPELASGGTTEHGVPVFSQLLGSDSDALALNARRAVELGAPGVDLNFGCPAKTVNNRRGGSILLRTPSQVAHIVRVVRDAVPAEVPVTAKGWVMTIATRWLTLLAAFVKPALLSLRFMHGPNSTDTSRRPGGRLSRM